MYEIDRQRGSNINRGKEIQLERDRLKGRQIEREQDRQKRRQREKDGLDSDGNKQRNRYRV